MIRFVISILLVLTVLESKAQSSLFKVPLSVSEMGAVQVLENVYVIHGVNGLPSPANGGLIANIGIVISDSGVIVFDSGGSARHGQLILNEISKITPKDVVAVFNTHIHGDHWLGNDTIAQRFPKAGFYARDDMVKRAKEGAGQQWKSILNGLTEGALSETNVYEPAKSITDGQNLQFGNITITVLHNEKAHTTTDSVLYVELPNKQSVAFMGDIALHQRTGRMDDGSFAGNIDLLTTIIDLNATVYIPGHGPSSLGPSSTQAYLDYLSLLYNETEALYEEGLTDFEIKEKIRPAFGKWHLWEGFDEGFGRHVNLIYLEIEEASF